MTRRVPHVMLIQNNDTLADIVLDVLSTNTESWGVTRYRDGESARRALDGGGLQRVLPDLILLDLELPDIPGLTLLGALKSNPLLKRIPVVVLGKGGRDTEATLAYSRGANLYVPKPASQDDFVIVVTELLLLWTNTAALPILSGRGAETIIGRSRRESVRMAMPGFDGESERSKLFTMRRPFGNDR